MDKLTIITVNFNNAAGLAKTLESVVSQTSQNFEYIVIDGGSTDFSIASINRVAGSLSQRLKWISEPDAGIYSAMNKGIRMATGDYLQFLNSGDCLSGKDVVELMLTELKAISEKNKTNIPILYGNLLKKLHKRILRDRGFAGKEVTFFDMFTGSLNHSSAYIRRDLFDKYGLYDENLKIVSDWKWFIEAILLGGEKPVYANIDVALFDLTGISSVNKELVIWEKRQVLSGMFPEFILNDYTKWELPIRQIKRLQRHIWAYKGFKALDRVLFKLEKHTRREYL